TTRRSSTQVRASGIASVSASSSCSSTTSTSRSRSWATKSAWSRCAVSTHMTSSNSSSFELVGVSRSCARPGAHTSTLRSLPTSECTPRVVGAVVIVRLLPPPTPSLPRGRRSRRRVAGFATHPDWDHVLWHPDLGDVPRYGTRLCRQVMGDLRADPRWRARAAESLPEEIAGDVPLDLFGLIDPLPAGATTIPWDGPRVEIVEHLAHAPGHAALLVPGSRTLVAGDMLSDLFVPMLDDPDVSEDPVAEY